MSDAASPGHSHGRSNQLLDALDAMTYASIEPHMERLPLDHGDSLFGRDGEIAHVFFPETAVISLIDTEREGPTAEVPTIGREGMVGLPSFLGRRRSSVDASVNAAGTVVRIGAERFHALAGVDGPLHQMMLRYLEVLLAQVARNASCGGRHRMDQRCARWLLVTSARVGRAEFPLTHEHLAFMLGAQRAGVTVSLVALEDAGLIRCSRGWVQVLDADRLQSASCSCFADMRASYSSILALAA